MYILSRLASIFMAFLMTIGIVGVDANDVKNVPESVDGAVRAISFNLHYASKRYGSVDVRSQLVGATILAYAPDIIGVQEATEQWLSRLDEILADKYERLGEKRDEEETTEYNCIYYLKDKYKAVKSGTFWLSETPRKKYTKSFGAICMRICTWAVLENKQTGLRFFHANTHLDNVSEQTRLKQAQVLLENIEKKAGKLPVILTGDFNSTEEEAAYLLAAESFDNTRLSAKNTEDGVTYHDYGQFSGETGAIDFIFVSKGTKVENYKIIDERIKKVFLSDHYGICSDIYIK